MIHFTDIDLILDIVRALINVHISTSLDEMNSWTQQQTVFLAQITEDISLRAYLAIDPDGPQLNIEAVRAAQPSCGWCKS